MLLAEALDSLSGGGGWAGAGLLGLVLAWLMLKHLPDKDKQITDLIDKHAERSDLQRKHYEESLDKVVTHCEREVAALTSGIGAKIDTLSDENRELHQTGRHQAANIANALRLKFATGEITLRDDAKNG